MLFCFYIDMPHINGKNIIICCYFVLHYTAVFNLGQVKPGKCECCFMVIYFISSRLRLFGRRGNFQCRIPLPEGVYISLE